MERQPYADRVRQALADRDREGDVFRQTLEALLSGLEPCLEGRPDYERAGVLEKLSAPERAVSFPVRWLDDRGRLRWTEGVYVRYSTALGPCRGGMVLRPGLDMDGAKALALEAVLAGSAAGLSLGGAAAGADVDVRTLSDGESRRFCRNLMEGLAPHMAEPPEDWLGLSLPRRERGYLLGSYELLADLGGRTPCPEPPGPMTPTQAAGHGMICFAQSVLHRGTGARLEGRSAVFAGEGSLAAWAGARAVQAGVTAVAVGSPEGYLYAPEGLPLSLLRAMAREPELPLLLRAIRTRRVDYCQGPGLWDVPADVWFFCGGGPPVDLEGAERLALHCPAGAFEAVPLAVSVRAARYLERQGVPFYPGFAAGAGCLALELCRRGGGAPTYWEAERLVRAVMDRVFRAAREEADEAGTPSLAAGAAMAAFRRWADETVRKGL